MAIFSDLPEIDSALACLRDARALLIAPYGLTEGNEWITPPPPHVGEALQMIHAAREHLENLCEFGSASYELMAR